MKYCQKCNVMLKDEVEVCPICGQTQIPAEEFEAKQQKKKKAKKTWLIVLAAVVGVVVAAYAFVMIAGKDPKRTGLNEEFTTEVEDGELTAQFAAYIMVALPQVWEGDDETTDSAIEYYKTDFPDVAAGFEQMKELRPVVGTLEDVSLDSATNSEEGRYKLTGEIICSNGKVLYDLIIGPSGYVDGLSFVLKEETPLQKARYYLLDLQEKL